MRALTVYVALTIIISAVLFEYFRYSSKETLHIEVVDKERITTTENETIQSYYLIFTDKGTFKLEDDIFYMNFRSSDVYGSLVRGNKYKIDVIGFRIGFLSEYQNIVKVYPI
jgi:uncharacterized membrane protein